MSSGNCRNTPNAARHILRTAACLLLLGLHATAFGGTQTLELYQKAVTLSPDPERGAKQFRSHCASCHGRQALGSADKVVPSLAGQVESYLLKQLIDFVELDRDEPEMHRVFARKELGQPQAWRDLAAYLSRLAPNERAQVGNGVDIMRGSRAYTSYCATCHGRSGEGREDAFVPALRSQHYSYLLLQLRSFDAERRTNTHPVLLEHMVDLDVDDKEALADFMSRMLPSRFGPAKTPEAAGQ
jgi:cytochrome c553